MSQQGLFIRTDPADLERYTTQNVPRRRKIPPEKAWRLELMRRALQSIPPRELQMLYAVKVLNIEQEEIAGLYNVRQSNISYRLERAVKRIRLFTELTQITSETQLRRRLIDLGIGEAGIRAVLGVVKTTSQSATAKTLGISQGSVRHLYAAAVERITSFDEAGKESALLAAVAANFSQMRAIETQGRWRWKVDGLNYPNAEE